MRNRLWYILMMLTIAGCSDRNAPFGAEPEFSAENVVCPADVMDGKIETEIVVVSNCSWSVSVEDAAEWVTLSDNQHLNPTGISMKRTLVAEVQRNDSHDERSAMLRFKGEGFERQVRLTQSGKENRMELVSPERVEVPCEPSAPSVISFRTNASWTAGVSEGASADVTIDRTEGKDDGEIAVSFGPNYSVTDALEAKVVITVDGLEPVEVVFTQSRNNPFIRVDNSSVTRVVSVEKAASIQFHANADWTASLLPGNTLDVRLSASEGSSSDRLLTMSFDENTSDDDRVADIRISLKDYDVSHVITVTQRGGLSLIADFADAAQPFVPEIPYGNTQSNLISNLDAPITYVLTQNGVDYEFLIGNHGYNTGKSDDVYGGYLMHGRGYVGLPAIDGKRLGEVQVLVAATNKKYSICEDAEGEVIVTGGSLSPVAKYATGTWILSDTETGRRYYLYCPDTGARIVRMTIIYK